MGYVVFVLLFYGYVVCCFVCCFVGLLLVGVVCWFVCDLLIRCLFVCVGWVLGFCWVVLGYDCLKL